MAATTDQTFLQAIDLSGRLVRAANFALDQWWIWLLAGAALWLVLKILCVPKTSSELMT